MRQIAVRLETDIASIDADQFGQTLGNLLDRVSLRRDFHT
jgi:hypothetical protein